MKTLQKVALSSAAAVSLLLLGGGAAFAAGTHSPHAVPTAPGQNKILCFDGTTDGGYGGICTLNSKGAKGTATLNNTDANPAGDYSGVYVANSTLTGQLLSAVTQLGYTYTGTTVPTPGNLSLNVPVNTSNGTTTDAYLFIDAAYCPGTGGVVDVIHDANCGIYYNGVTFYPNWAALVAAYPGATVATDNLSFVIAERTPAEGPALWTISDLTLGKPGK